MLKIRYISSIVLALNAPALLMAQPFGMHNQADMAQMKMMYDTDNDGRVTREEVQAARTDIYNEADTDNSGSLDLAELTAMKAAQKEQRLATKFAYLDSNSDNLISKEEFINARPDTTEIAIGQLF